MIPLKDNVGAGGRPVVTATLIALCLLVFLWQLTLSGERGSAGERNGDVVAGDFSERDEFAETYGATPAQVAAVVASVDEGKLSTKLARQVVEGVLAGEGEPEEVMTARGLALVRDDSVTQAAVDEALAANPDVAEKIRGGKVAAAGAIVGAVMKANRGQADAARVRELVLAACGQG